MSDVYEQTRAYFREAKARINSADVVVDDIARLLEGRLRRVNASTLRRLKRELRDFDMTTGNWKR